MMVYVLYNLVLYTSIILLFIGIVMLCASLVMLKRYFERMRRFKIAVEKMKKEDSTNKTKPMKSVYKRKYGSELYQYSYTMMNTQRVMPIRVIRSTQKKYGKIMAFYWTIRKQHANKKVKNLNTKIKECDSKLQRILK